MPHPTCSHSLCPKVTMNWMSPCFGYQLPLPVESRLRCVRTQDTPLSCSLRVSTYYRSWAEGSSGWFTKESGRALPGDESRWLWRPSTVRRRRTGTNCSKRPSLWDSSTTQMWLSSMESLTDQTGLVIRFHSLDRQRCMQSWFLNLLQVMLIMEYLARGDLLNHLIKCR